MSKVSAMFNILAEQRIDAKRDEAAAIEKRREADAQIIALEEFQEIKKDKGEVSLKSDKWKIAVKFTVSERQDVSKIADELPHDAIDRIFPQVRQFSQTAFNVYIKELTNLAMTDAKARKLLARINQSLEDHTTRSPGAPQVTVTPISE